MSKWIRTIWAALALFVLNSLTAFAAANPITGDDSGTTLGIMIALLAVSVVLIVAYVIFTMKRKK